MKLFSKRTGQAALEYLVTYGWALAVIVVAIGVLSYFNFLNPNKYIPDNCEFGEQLKCVDHYIEAADDGTAGKIVIRFRNNFEDSINITYGSGVGKPVTFEGDTVNNYVVINRGEIGRVYFDTTEQIFPGNKERFGITLQFKRTGGTVTHNITGEVFKEVSENTLNLLS